MDGNFTRIILARRLSYDLIWHPSGQQITYSAYMDSSQLHDEIRSINIDGTDDHVLVSSAMNALIQIPSNENATVSQWAPSGDLLTYFRGPLGGDDHLYLADMSDGSTWQIPRGGGWPVWSSDSRYLAYVNNLVDPLLDTGYELYVFRLQDHSFQVLVDEYIDNPRISWQPSP